MQNLRLRAAESTSGDGVTAACLLLGKVAGQLASCWDTLWLRRPVLPTADPGREYFGSVPPDPPLIFFLIAKSFNISIASCLLTQIQAPIFTNHLCLMKELPFNMLLLNWCCKMENPVRALYYLLRSGTYYARVISYYIIIFPESYYKRLMMVVQLQTKQFHLGMKEQECVCT